MNRSWLHVGVFAVAVLLAASTASGVRAETPVPLPMRDIAVEEQPGTALPLHTSFVDTHGRKVRLARFFDGEQPVVLILAYTRCPMLCNLVLRGAVEALPQLEWVLGRDFRVLTILIDPNETVHSAREKQRTVLDALGREEAEAWPFLIGRERDIRAVADALGFGYRRDPKSGQYAHPALLTVVTPRGRIASYLHGIQFPPEKLRPALRNAAAGHIAPSPTVGEAVMSCFRFDPALRKYGGRIQAMFRIGGFLLLLALFVTVGLLFRWERRRRS